MQKQIFKLSEMIIDPKQIFWQMKYCYALIPLVQLLDGHILLTTRRDVACYTQLQPAQIFDLGLTIKFLTRSFENYYSCSATTVYLQNFKQESNFKQLIIHIIPRKPKDMKNNDELYTLLDKYPEELLNHYNEKMNYYINAYANKILEGIHQQSKKYQTHLNMCFKQEKQN